MHKLPVMSPAEAKGSDLVRVALQGAVDEANSLVSQAESIRHFVVLDADFTEESGHLTPSLKLKRAAVVRDFAAQIDRIYG